MKMMLKLEKMNVQGMISNNEQCLLKLNSTNELATVSDSNTECLFFDVKLSDKTTLYVRLFDRVGENDNIWTRMASKWEQVLIVFSMVMVLLMISGCRNESLISSDPYAQYACNHQSWFITFFAGLAIALVFAKNFKRKTESKKLAQKRKRAKML